MKVSELISKLQKLDQDKPICIKFTDTTNWIDVFEIPEIEVGNDINENGESLHFGDGENLFDKEDELKEEFEVYILNLAYGDENGNGDY